MCKFGGRNILLINVSVEDTTSTGPEINENRNPALLETGMETDIIESRNAKCCHCPCEITTMRLQLLLS